MKQITRLADSPEWQALQTQENDLKLRLNAIEREVSEAISKQGVSDAGDRLSREVIAYLNGEQPGPSRNSQEIMDDLFHRRKIATKALELHRQKMREIKARLSAEICRELKPQYAKLVRQILDTALELNKLMTEERNFRDEMFQGDIAFSAHFEPMVLPWLGLLEDPYSRISSFFQSAERAGYINHSIN